MARRVSSTKSFGGKRYKFWGTYGSKKEAENEAKALRGRGWLARYSRFVNVYVVYIRKA